MFTLLLNELLMFSCCLQMNSQTEEFGNIKLFPAELPNNVYLIICCC